MNDRHAVADTGLAELTLVASDAALVGVYFPHHWVRPDRATLGAEVSVDTDPLLSVAATQLREYLAGQRRAFDLPIALHGEAFQQQVWAIIEEIPYGETRTYGEIAEQLGDPTMARAVGRAVGDNPLSIVVPCHRVLGKNGTLTGYAGGLKRKRALLELEERGTAKAAGRLF